MSAATRDEDLKRLRLGLLGMELVDQQRAEIKRIAAFIHQFPLEGITRDTRLSWELVVPARRPRHDGFRLWMSTPAYPTGYYAKFWLEYDELVEGIIRRTDFDLAKDDVPKQFVPETWMSLMGMLRGAAVFNQDVLTEFDSWVEAGRLAQVA